MLAIRLENSLDMPYLQTWRCVKLENYRRVHLTTMLSKMIEKMVGAHLVPYPQRTAFGANQWAFTLKLISRDFIAMLTLSFILTACAGDRF
jgi:hypothetical protein